MLGCGWLRGRTSAMSLHLNFSLANKYAAGFASKTNLGTNKEFVCCRRLLSNFFLLLQGSHLRWIVRMANDKPNLTQIKWAHAVNSQAELGVALKSDVDMIEADIVLGKLNSAGPDLPVMGHPPANSSDITLTDFLGQIRAHNAAHVNDKKGIKLDFKSIEVFEGSLEILSELIPQMSYPIWLNADIVRGPVNQTDTVPVNPDLFFAGCAKFSKAVLSIGWTTRWGSNNSEGSYTANEIDNMLHAIKSNNATETRQPITFPVRAGIAANSQEQLHELVAAVSGTNECTLTVWSSKNDYVDVEKLRELIISFGIERVYLDVPEELAIQLLDIGRSGAKSGFVANGLLGFGLVSACMIAANSWLQRV